MQYVHDIVLKFSRKKDWEGWSTEWRFTLMPPGPITRCVNVHISWKVYVFLDYSCLGDATSKWVRVCVCVCVPVFSSFHFKQFMYLEFSWHQEALRALWAATYPDQELHGLISDQWKEMGWQGKDPSTDFRFLYLIMLLIFSSMISWHIVFFYIGSSRQFAW